MMQRTHGAGGFTLVELMIVVAIIGVLAAVAIPSFLSYQASARRAEAMTNLSAIGRTQKGFLASSGHYHHTGAPYPDWVAQIGDLSTKKMDWDEDSQNAWDEMGWKPEGKVFHSYESNVCCASELCFTATAYGDVDDDDIHSVVMYVEPERSGGVIVSECPALMFGGTFTTPLGPNGKVFSQAAVNAKLDRF